MRPICLCRATKADVVARFLADAPFITADRVMIAERQLDILFDSNSHEEVFGVFVRELYEYSFTICGHFAFRTCRLCLGLFCVLIPIRFSSHTRIDRYFAKMHCIMCQE